jgi:hypothetical protein
MSRKVYPITLKAKNQLHIVVGAMELGDYLVSLKACERVMELAVALRDEILQLLKESHQDDLTRHTEEIDAIKAMMPRQGALSRNP